MDEAGDGRVDGVRRVARQDRPGSRGGGGAGGDGRDGGGGAGPRRRRGALRGRLRGRAGGRGRVHRALRRHGGGVGGPVRAAGLELHADHVRDEREGGAAELPGLRPGEDTQGRGRVRVRRGGERRRRRRRRRPPGGLAAHVRPGRARGQGRAPRGELRGGCRVLLPRRPARRRAHPRELRRGRPGRCGCGLRTARQFTNFRMPETKPATNFHSGPRRRPSTSGGRAGAGRSWAS